MAREARVARCRLRLPLSSGMSFRSLPGAGEPTALGFGKAALPDSFSHPARDDLHGFLPFRVGSSPCCWHSRPRQERAVVMES